MNQAVPLSVVLLILVGAGALYLLGRFIRVCAQVEVSLSAAAKANKENTAALADIAAGMVTFAKSVDGLLKGLAPAAEELRVNMASVPKLLEMVAKIGQAQLEIAQQQRAEQQERLRNPFGRQNGPVPPRDVAAANQEYEIQQMVRSEGISREEAMLRMNPANTGSVWDGLTEGWR